MIKAMPHNVDHHAILDRLSMTRSGVGNTFTDIDPQRTAHIVIDMQNGFMEEGAPVEVPVARSIVGNVNRVAAAVRKSGGHNIFVRFTTPPEGGPAWPSFMTRLGVGAEAFKQAFTTGAHYWQLSTDLELQDEDRIIDKHRFSAFTHGTSGLHELLGELGVETVIITGTLTNCCCESTARDAFQYNYQVLMVADANAALSDDEHAATLHNMAFVFADLYSTAEIEQLLAAT